MVECFLQKCDCSLFLVAYDRYSVKYGSDISYERMDFADIPIFQKLLEGCLWHIFTFFKILFSKFLLQELSSLRQFIHSLNKNLFNTKF